MKVRMLNNCPRCPLALETDGPEKVPDEVLAGLERLPDGKFTGKQWFEYEWGENELLAWDVSRAIREVARSRFWREREGGVISPEQVRAILRGTQIQPAHVGHVSGSLGLAVRAPDLTTGQLAHLLIDGNHRAARCLREGRDFHVLILTEEEERICRLSREEVEEFRRRAGEVAAFVYAHIDVADRLALAIHAAAGDYVT